MGHVPDPLEGRPAGPTAEAREAGHRLMTLELVRLAGDSTTRGQPSTDASAGRGVHGDSFALRVSGNRRPAMAGAIGRGRPLPGAIGDRKRWSAGSFGFASRGSRVRGRYAP